MVDCPRSGKGHASGKQKTVRHPILYGEYELTIDEKNRLLVPADIRRSIGPEQGESLFMVGGSNGVPWFYPAKYYQDLGEQAPSELTPPDDVILFNQLHFGMTSQLPWDKQGRLQLPAKPLKRCSIGREVTLVGVNDHLQLWNRAAWDEHSDDLLRRQAEIVARNRMNSRPPQPPMVGPHC